MIQRLLLLFAIFLPDTRCFQFFPTQVQQQRIMTTTSTGLSISLKEEDLMERPKVGILRVDGPDRKGIVAAFAQVLYGQ